MNRDSRRMRAPANAARPAQQDGGLDKFVKDLFDNGQIQQISLQPYDFADIISNIQKFKLDFDDAYQLTTSQKYGMTIVTFDKDFNTEGINKTTPEEILRIQ